MVPRWTFFAPNPASSDYHLLYRDRLADGRLTEWRRALARRPKSVLVMLLNPQKRRQKAISDFGRSFNRSNRRARGSVRALQLSMSYIALLHYVAHAAPHADGAVETQFAVVQTFGFLPERERRVVMHSALHALR